MGKRGPRTTPTALKLVRGNPGKRALNHSEPKAPAPVKAPSPPAHLDDAAKICWNELAPLLLGMRLLTDADYRALELLCATYSEWRSARVAVANAGATYETVNESGGRIVRAHPAVAIAADAWRRSRQMMIEFGLTPSARATIKLPPAEKKDPFAEFMSRGKARRA